MDHVVAEHGDDELQDDGYQGAEPVRDGGDQGLEGLAAEDHSDRGPADAGEDIDVGDREEVSEEARAARGPGSAAATPSRTPMRDSTPITIEPSSDPATMAVTEAVSDSP